MSGLLGDSREFYTEEEAEDVIKEGSALFSSTGRPKKRM